MDTKLTLKQSLLSQRLAHLRADLTMERPVTPEMAKELVALLENMETEISILQTDLWDAQEERDEAYQEGYDEALSELEASTDEAYERGYADGQKDVEVSVGPLSS